MGREKTGATTCEAVQRIELSFLLKAKYLVKGQMRTAKLLWTCNGYDSGNINIETYWGKQEKYVRLMYQVKDRFGEKFDYDYKVQLTTLPSNLGKGEVLYFVCPDSGKRCRILYCAYSYHKWKSREAYQHRIYYKTQISSKLDYANDRYWQLQRRLEAIYQEKYLRWEYNGKPTKRAIRIRKMEQERDYWDEERWGLHNMPAFLRDRFEGRGFSVEDAIVA